MRRRRRWALGSLAALLAIAGAAVVVDRLAPPDLARYRSVSHVVEARDGSLLHVATTRDGYWRLQTGPNDVSPRYLAMLTDIEDKRFWSHPGVDPLALLRALGQYLGHGHVVSGGSTLTMQTARLLMPHRHDVAGKLLDIARALQLEARYSKRDILAMYLTLAPFGGNIEGVRAASLIYFGHEPAALSTEEAALLVALPQSPEHQRPDRHRARAEAGRAKILARLGLPPATTPVPAARAALPRLAPYLAVRLAGDPGTTRTTIDAALQRRVEDIARREQPWLGAEANIAALVVANRDRAVLAYLGGADYTNRNGGMVDMVRARRSPGSTLKPFFYGMALDDALIQPDSLIDDTALRLGGYAPRDVDRSFRGTVTVREALQQSYNLPAVKVLQAVGPARFLARLEAAGAQPKLPRGPRSASLPIALGGLGIDMADLAMLYAGLADHGMAAALRLVDTNASVAARPLMGLAAAWEIGDILRGTPRPDGVAPLRGRPVAYKTGTSYGFRDAWAAGFSPAYTIIVWVGRTEGSPRPGAYGRDTAAPLLFRLFDLLPPESSSSPVPPPGAIRQQAAPRLASGLGRFSTRKGDGLIGPAPRILFPPPGATLEVSGGDGTISPVGLEASGGTPPYRWTVNGLPLKDPAIGTGLDWAPDGPGFAHISVTDSRDRSASADIRLR